MSAWQVPADTLSFKYKSDHISFQATDELEDLLEPIGQERAIEALQFGTNIKCPGYNIYALGSSGIGKHEIIEQFLRQKVSNGQTPLDWAYVNNFAEPGKPIAISFPAGTAKIFQQQIRQLVEDLRTTVPSLYESERYRTQRDSLIKEFKEQQDKALAALQERAKKENIYLLTIRGSLFFAQGDKDGNILDEATISQLSPEEQKASSERISKFNNDLANLINQFPIEERQMRLRIKNLNREMISSAVEALVSDIKKKYSEDRKISDYIQSMVRDIIDNARDFRRHQDETLEVREEVASTLRRYEVNVIVEHSQTTKLPIIYEDNPTFMNLVGQIEHISQLGALITDFTLIRTGALHRANSGYLVLDAFKLLSSPYAWEGLKRALKSEQIRIESLGQVYSLVSTVTLKPEPIPLNCKVILIGESDLYHLLTQYDPEFSELFRVSADFESDIVRDEKNESRFVRLLGSLARKYNLKSLDFSGATRVLEYSTRLSSDNERLSINLREITDLLKEADFFAKESKRDLISNQDIQKAIDAQVHRASRIYEKVIEETKRGVLLIDVAGESIGQVNGLSIFEFGNHLFGHPTRITAIVRMGDGHVVDIEREVKMGGPIHSKGVLILSGFLKSRFATDVPFSISASVVFEQSYGLVEGDSASMAELVALLSAISQLPVKQSFAITGSVNQHGEAQAVGGINQKIEGFYDLCCHKGLTGDQAVIIPRSNINHLALRNDVIESVRRGQFSIYAVETIDDCMHLLTGMPVQMINEKIEARLRTFAKQLGKIMRLNEADQNLLSM
ncbi:MAG: ATP-dependent protease [Oligoflexia bacterium]|nr:MAG: ATP-dependent protease [Oligoflexia bacterium]